MEGAFIKYRFIGNPLSLFALLLAALVCVGFSLGQSGDMVQVLFTILLAISSAASGALYMKAKQTRRNSLREPEDSALFNRHFEERLLTLLNEIPSLLWIASADGSLSWVNKALNDLLPFSPSAIAHQGWNALVHPEEREAIHHTINGAIHRGENFSVEHRLIGNDGSIRWVINHGVPLHQVEDRERKYIGSLIDITAQKVVEQSHRDLLENEKRLRAEVEKTTRSKDQFLATLSHELRTPLNAILGWVQLLRRSRGNEARILEGLEIIERNSRAQAQIIADLLDMSRITSGKVRLEFQQVDLPSLIGVAIEGTHAAASEKGIVVGQEIESGIPPFKGDPGRLQQVLSNLLSNAVRHSKPQGRITVYGRRQDNFAEIAVQDDGDGIDATFLPNVFDMFAQADSSTNRRHGGLGLGLAIVRRIIEMHGGSVTAASEGKGRGARFTIRLPLRPALVAEKKEAVEGDATYIPPTLLDGKSVVVVEDQQDALALFKEVLTDAGASVSTASSADAALDLFHERHFDALVSDIAMSEKDGYELIQELRNMPASEGGDTPAIAVTAFSRNEDRQRVLEAGFQAHLAKPVEPIALVRTVAELFAHH